MLGIRGIKNESSDETNDIFSLPSSQPFPGCETGGKLKSSCQTSENTQWCTCSTPPPTPPAPRHHLHRRPSTNAQRSWTTSIWGIILYEIDGWGQPLTERVKTTLRRPLWISMMENRLLKKIYVCSPLPQERSPPPPPLPAALPHPHPPTPLPPALTNQTCHCGQIKLSGSVRLPALRQLARCHAQWQEAPFCCCCCCCCCWRGRSNQSTCSLLVYDVLQASWNNP